MQVLFDKVAIVSKGKAERTNSGLYIAPSSDEALVVAGTVAAAGPLAEEFVKEGDTVWFNKHGAFPVTVDGVEYRVISVKELLVLVRPKVKLEDVLAETKPLPAEPETTTTAMYSPTGEKVGEVPAIAIPKLIKL